MAETTSISWADATLNFWIGCTEVSNGKKGACAFCYAKDWGNRFGVKWGVGEERRLCVDPLGKARAIEARGRREGRRLFVFSNSLSDILDNEVPIAWLVDALTVAAATPGNIYLWLTKRAPQMLKRLVEALRLAGLDRLPANIALGITVVTQDEANQGIPWLLKAKAALSPTFVFLSVEPMMERIDLADACRPAGWDLCAIDWVICGMESGAHARPGREYWAAHLREQCAGARVPFQFKQWGEWAPAGYSSATIADMSAWVSAGRPEVLLRSPKVAICIGPRTLPGDQVPIMSRVGKKASGRLLAGQLHDARPAVAHA
jgi:protein gp37